MNKDVLKTNELDDMQIFKGEPLRGKITKSLKVEEKKKNPDPEKVFDGYKGKKAKPKGKKK